MYDQDWRLLARCAGHSDPNLFFDRERDAEARTFCHGCSVRVDCNAWAVRHRMSDGMWGGRWRQNRRSFTDADVAEMRQRHRQGESIRAIGRAFGVDHHRISQVVKAAAPC